jgi:FMN phosphatase YigB (HAD superfamily)
MSNSEISEVKPVVVFDIDGTLADTSHRLHHLYPFEGMGVKKDWGSFFAAAKDDPPIQSTININNLYSSSPNIKVIALLTGRPDNTREDTETWLNKYNVKYDILIMRSSSDRRPDHIVKKELLLGFLEFHKYTTDNVEAIFEDRAHIAEEWKLLKLPVFLVGNERL